MAGFVVRWYLWKMMTEDNYYLKTAKISNYQSIKDLELEFTSGLTTIVGKSSTGKSAILRALNTLAFNTNSPQLRAGAKSLNVTAQLAGATVSVTRGKSLSTYAVNDEQYTKAGVSVPDAVKPHIGLVDKDLHFNFQFDKPYLLAETGSVVTSILGKLTHANVLREAIREGSRRAQQAKQQSAQRTSDAADLQQRLDTEFADLDLQEALVKGVTAQVVGAETKLSTSQKIFDSLLKIQDIQKKAGRVKTSLVERPDQTEVLDAAQVKLYQAQQITNAASAAIALGEKVQQAVQKVTQAEQACEYADLNYAEALKSLAVCPTCGRKMAVEHYAH